MGPPPGFEPTWRGRRVRVQSEPNFAEGISTSITNALRELQQKQERELFYRLGLAASIGAGLRVKIGQIENNWGPAHHDPYVYSMYQEVKFEVAHDLSAGEVVIQEQGRMSADDY